MKRVVRTASITLLALSVGLAAGLAPRRAKLSVVQGAMRREPPSLWVPPRTDPAIELEPAPAGLAAPIPDREPPPGPEVVPCAGPVAGLACVAGGAFIRGADHGSRHFSPADTVWLQTYYMDRYEVTVAEYRECIKEGRCNKAGPAYTDFSDPRQPITGVSWYDAVQYCQVHGKHLPTEAEWEKAARGPNGNLYPWGNQKVDCDRAIIRDERGRSCGVLKRFSQEDVGKPFPVGSRPPGVYGLYDMSGNSWEWVYDWDSPSYAECGESCLGIDPRGPCDGAEECPGHKQRLVRGGSWFWVAALATSVYRRPHYPANRPFHHFGFRCAASAAEAAALRSILPEDPALQQASSRSVRPNHSKPGS